MEVVINRIKAYVHVCFYSVVGTREGFIAVTLYSFEVTYLTWTCALYIGKMIVRKGHSPVQYNTCSVRERCIIINLCLEKF